MTHAGDLPRSLGEVFQCGIPEELGLTGNGAVHPLHVGFSQQSNLNVSNGTIQHTNVDVKHRKQIKVHL